MANLETYNWCNSHKVDSQSSVYWETTQFLLAHLMFLLQKFQVIFKCPESFDYLTVVIVHHIFEQGLQLGPKDFNTDILQWRNDRELSGYCIK